MKHTVWSVPQKHTSWLFRLNDKWRQSKKEKTLPLAQKKEEEDDTFSGAIPGVMLNVWKISPVFPRKKRKMALRGKDNRWRGQSQGGKCWASFGARWSGEIKKWRLDFSFFVSGNVLQNRVCFRRNVIFSLLLTFFFAGKCVSVYISLWEKIFEVKVFFSVGDCDARDKAKLDCS